MTSRSTNLLVLLIAAAVLFASVCEAESPTRRLLQGNSEEARAPRGNRVGQAASQGAANAAAVVPSPSPSPTPDPAVPVVPVTAAPLTRTAAVEGAATEPATGTAASTADTTTTEEPAAEGQKGVGNNNANNANNGQGAARRQENAGAKNTGEEEKPAAEAIGPVTEGPAAKTAPKAETATNAQEPETVRTRLADLFQKDNTEAAAGAIATAGSEGFGSSTAVAAGTAAVNQAKAGKVEAVADSFAVAAAQNTDATAAVLAKAAVEARSSGDARAFARSQARAFVKARSRNHIDSYCRAVARAIRESENKDVVIEVYVITFVEAFDAEEEAEALALATAFAFCEGGDVAIAFAQAYSTALSRNKKGCAVLTRSRAIAVAQCDGGLFRTGFDIAVVNVETEILEVCSIKTRFGLEPAAFRLAISG